jgi:uncharacterized protein (TIGR03084 family)
MEGPLMTAVNAVAKIAVLRSVVADLRAETTEIVSVLSGLRPSRWDASTPADGWTIRDQVTHLAFFDDATMLALADPASFEMQREQLLAFGDGFPDEVADRYRALPAQTCLDWLIRSRDRLLTGYLGTDPSHRIPWYGPDMGLASSATGRLMETWAHGQDIVDTVGLVRPATHRLRGIADLGVRTLGFSFQLNRRPPPAAPVRVELNGPDNDRWRWGPDDAPNRVTGDALDFCLAVTQRRHLSDTNLSVVGPVATEWMSIAQAYAGAAGPGRPAGQFAVERSVR